MPLENSGNKITSVRKCKEKVVIRFANKTKLDIPNDVFTSFYLYKGKILTNTEIKDIKDNINISKLLEYAKKISTTRVYSENKMREKLYLKNASKKEVDAVIDNLKKARLIDDLEFAQEYLEYSNSRNVGKNKIIAKLKQKGIFDDNIAKLHFDEKLEYQKASAHLESLEKKYDKYNYNAKKNHVVQSLVNLGFDLDVALTVASKVKASKPKEEKKKLEQDFSKAIKKYKDKYDKYKLKEKVMTYLLSKGYKIDEINHMWEEYKR